MIQPSAVTAANRRISRLPHVAGYHPNCRTDHDNCARRTVCCMRAWVVDRPGPMASGPLRLAERPVPEPGPGELLVRVICCGVCRTDLHLAEGDLPPRAPDI